MDKESERLEAEADRLLEEWALNQPQSHWHGTQRGPRKRPGHVLRREGILSRSQLERIEGIEVPLSAFGDGRDLVEEDD